MRSRVHRKYRMKEYYINQGYMRKLYMTYMDKPWYNRFLDKLVFLAMLSIVVSVAVHFFVISLPPLFFWILSSTTVFIVAVFSLELIRMYMHSRSKTDFIKHHWLDFILISFLSFYFVFIGVLGLLKLALIELISPFMYEAKDARVMFKFFRK